MLAESDLELSLSAMKVTVSPLLDDREDVCHIIPASPAVSRLPGGCRSNAALYFVVLMFAAFTI